MSFKKKSNGKWYNGNGELIRNPKAYAYSLYGRPYKNPWWGNNKVVINININGKTERKYNLSKEEFLEKFDEIDDDLPF